MKFTITGKKLEVSEELRAYAEKKVGKIERLFRSGDSEAFITFSRERGRYTAEVTLKNNGMFYRVSETTGDMFASIDSACASIERQIRKNKTRLEKKLKAGPIEWTDTGVGPVDEEEESGDFTIVRTPDVTSFAPEEPEEGTFEIVRKKEFNMKPMTREEAILQMNLLEHTFFAFRDEDNDGAFAVVYKRKDGGYGLIEDAE